MEQKQAGLFNRTKLHVFRDWLTGRPSTVRCRRRRTGVDDWIPKNRFTIHNCVEESSLVSACTLKENELETQGQKSHFTILVYVRVSVPSPSINLHLFFCRIVRSPIADFP